MPLPEGFVFRADGWPLCPQCGEDELWSPLIWDGQGAVPPLTAYMAAGLQCYACNYILAPKKDA